MFPAAGQAHGDEAGQRRGFEEAAIDRLNAREDFEGVPARAGADRTDDGVPRRPVIMPGLANGDERGQSIADHGQTQGGKPSMREGGQFEGERNDMAPGLGACAEFPGQGAHRQDGDGKCPVLSVATDHGSGEAIRFESAGLPAEPAFCAGQDGGVGGVGGRLRRTGRSPTEGGGAQVADALDSVPPAAVRVDMIDQPASSGPSGRVERRLDRAAGPLKGAEGHDGGGG